MRHLQRWKLQAASDKLQAEQRKRSLLAACRLELGSRDYGQPLTGAGKVSPVMRIAPNVVPSRRTRSATLRPSTCAYPVTFPQKLSFDVVLPMIVNSLTVRKG